MGPIARTVKDAAYILQAIAGVDPRDNYTSAIPNGTLPDYVKACNLSALKGARIGIPDNVIPFFRNLITDPEWVAYNQSWSVLREAGATIVENTYFTGWLSFLNDNPSTQVLEADFFSNLPDYLKLLTFNPNNVTSLADIQKFTQSSALEKYPERDTNLWSDALGRYNNTNPRFWELYSLLQLYGDVGGLLGAIRRDNLDAVILPSSMSADFAAGIGAPVVTVPLGSYPNSTAVTKDSWGMVQYAPNLP